MNNENLIFIGPGIFYDKIHIGSFKSLIDELGTAADNIGLRRFVLIMYDGKAYTQQQKIDKSELSEKWLESWTEDGAFQSYDGLVVQKKWNDNTNTAYYQEIGYITTSIPVEMENRLDKAEYSIEFNETSIKLIQEDLKKLNEYLDDLNNFFRKQNDGDEYVNTLWEIMNNFTLVNAFLKDADATPEAINTLQEIQNKFSEIEPFFVEADLSEETICTLKEIQENLNTLLQRPTFIRNENGSEIFNDLRARTYDSTTSKWLGNTSTGEYAHVENSGNRAIGKSSHAEGYNTLAQGTNSHSEGDGTKATGYTSHSEGFQTEATKEQSHAEGYRTKASGYAAHSEGQNNLAKGTNSHVEGKNNQALHEFSHVGGFENTTTADNQTVIGSCALPSEKSLFTIGNGKIEETINYILLESQTGHPKAGYKYYTKNNSNIYTDVSQSVFDNGFATGTDYYYYQKKCSNALEVFEDGSATLATQGEAKAAIVINETLDNYVKKGDATGYDDILTKTDAEKNYLKLLDASDTYLTKNELDTTIGEKVQQAIEDTTDLDNYLTKGDASKTYLTKSDAERDYVPWPALQNNYYTNSAIDQRFSDMEEAQQNFLSNYIKFGSEIPTTSQTPPSGYVNPGSECQIYIRII